MILFLKSLLFGFLLAATVGPMWVLCLRRTLAQGALTGLASGMGIAVAAFGLTAVSSVLLKYSFWIGLAGGMFLLYLGVKCLAAKPAQMQENPRERTSLPQARAGCAAASGPA